MKPSYYNEFYRALATRFSQEKTADIGQVVHAIVEPPASLLSAVGHGLQGAGQSAAHLTASMPEHDTLTRGLAAIPAAIRGGVQGFTNNGGLRAAALTGMGALGVYGAKRLYDESQQPAAPSGYYAPGGY